MGGGQGEAEFTFEGGVRLALVKPGNGVMMAVIDGMEWKEFDI